MNKHIGIQANTGKPEALRTAALAWEAIAAAGATPLFERETAGALGREYRGLEGIEVLVVIGGDGTILRSVELSMKQNAPIAGVNLGKTGFLSDIEPTEMTRAMQMIVAGEFVVEPRSLIQCQVGGKSHLALNDILLYKANVSHMIEVMVTVDGREMGAFGCDGVLISTPTGSTAYSLSAGGPVVAPNVEATLVTPICPHTLSARPMVIAREDVVRLTIKADCANVSCDGGEISVSFNPDDVLTARASQKRVKFLHFPGYNFFELVRKKLY